MLKGALWERGGRVPRSLHQGCFGEGAVCGRWAGQWGALCRQRGVGFVVGEIGGDGAKHVDGGVGGCWVGGWEWGVEGDGVGESCGNERGEVVFCAGDGGVGGQHVAVNGLWTTCGWVGDGEGVRGRCHPPPPPPNTLPNTLPITAITHPTARSPQTTYCPIPPPNARSNGRRAGDVDGSVVVDRAG